MSTSIGTTLGPMIAIAYLANYSFKSMLLITVVLMLFSFICSLFVKNIKIEEPTEQKTATKEPFYTYMFDRRILVPSILVALNYMAISGTVNFIGALGNEMKIGGEYFTVFHCTRDNHRCC